MVTPGIVAGSSPGAQSYRELLQSLSKYVEHKFKTGTATELTPNNVIKFIDALIKLKNELEGINFLSESDQDALQRIDPILDQCYAANSLFNEADKRKQFFTELRAIAALVKKL